MDPPIAFTHASAYPPHTPTCLAVAELGAGRSGSVLLTSAALEQVEWVPSERHSQRLESSTVGPLRRPARMTTTHSTSDMPVTTAADAASKRVARDAQLADLLRSSAAGNASAFESFYDQTVGYAQALARRMVRPGDLDDVLADAYFQAWREAARFDPQRGGAVAWLLTVVRTRALDLLRQHRANQHEELTDDTPETESSWPGPDELLANTRADSRLHAALAELSANERWVLGLAYFRELTHQQIAQCTGLPLGSVKSLILRSQTKLRERLNSA